MPTGPHKKQLAVVHGGGEAPSVRNESVAVQIVFEGEEAEYPSSPLGEL